jgi:hypothetical protein
MSGVPFQGRGSGRAMDIFWRPFKRRDSFLRELERAREKEYVKVPKDTLKKLESLSRLILGSAEEIKDILCIIEDNKEDK